jgi:hypothetical protein
MREVYIGKTAQQKLIRFKQGLQDSSGVKYMSQWGQVRTKYLRSGSHEMWAAVIILLAVALRIALIALGWPQLDSDEGTMGIMAMHILRGERPVFFYAQGYMGAAEAYLAAALFSLFGVSTFMLRFALIFLFALFLIGMYLLTSMLYTKRWALVTLSLLCFGSAPILTRELVAIGGYVETLMFGAFLLVFALWLAFSAKPDIPHRHQWHRILLYSFWGLMAGVSFWTDPLVAPFLLTGGLILLIFCWRELLSWVSLLLVLGALIGISPMIPYNLDALLSGHPEQTTWNNLKSIQEAGGSGVPLPPFQVLFSYQVKGALLISMPGATGANPLCPVKTAPLQGVSVPDIHFVRFENLQEIRCTLVHSGWSLGIIALWFIATFLALKGLWQLHRSSAHPWSAEVRKSIICQSGRFALLFNGLLVLLVFLISPAAALYPVPDMRYLVGLLVTTPALLWPLWQGTGTLKPFALKFSRVAVAVKLALLSAIVRRGILLLITLVFLLGTFSTFSGIPPAPPAEERQDRFAIIGVYQYLGVPATQAFNREEAALIDNLLRIGITHIYSDYWTCDRLIFRSQEKIICAVKKMDQKGEMRTGQNRYAPYRKIVEDDPYAAYVFRVGTPEAAYKERNYKNARKKHERYSFNGYVIIRPR